MDNFEDDLIAAFEDLQFECRKMNRNTTLYQFQDALSTIFNEIREREIQNEHNPISLLYEPNEVLESPMARIANDHVSFQFFL